MRATSCTKPHPLPRGVRWISRTADQDCLGVLLPATAESDGYRAKKAKGNVKILAPRSTVRMQLEAGLLVPDAARAMEETIRKILGSL